MTKSPPKSELIDVAASEAALLAETGSQTAVIVQRLGTHRDAMDMALRALEGERADMVARRDNMRRQYEAADSGLAMHLADIDACIGLYVAGLNELPKEGAGE